MSCACKPAAAPVEEGDDGCSGAESFALRVLGDDMAPEFDPGDIVIIEPGGALRDGSFVLVQQEGEWLLRRLGRRGDGWVLSALNRPDSEQALPDLGNVRGVVIQKAVPGRRRLSRFYV